MLFIKKTSLLFFILLLSTGCNANPEIEKNPIQTSPPSSNNDEIKLFTLNQPPQKGVHSSGVAGGGKVVIQSGCIYYFDNPTDTSMKSLPIFPYGSSLAPSKKAIIVPLRNGGKIYIPFNQNRRFGISRMRFIMSDSDRKKYSPCSNDVDTITWIAS